MRWRLMARKLWHAAKVMRTMPGWERSALSMVREAGECAKLGRKTESTGEVGK